MSTPEHLVVDLTKIPLEKASKIRWDVGRAKYGPDAGPPDFKAFKGNPVKQGLEESVDTKNYAEVTRFFDNDEAVVAKTRAIDALNELIYQLWQEIAAHQATTDKAREG